MVTEFESTFASIMTTHQCWAETFRQIVKSTRHTCTSKYSNADFSQSSVYFSAIDLDKKTRIFLGTKSEIYYNDESLCISYHNLFSNVMISIVFYCSLLNTTIAEGTLDSAYARFPDFECVVEPWVSWCWRWCDAK